MQNNKFLTDTLLYFDIFGFPLTLNEFHKYLIGEKTSKNELFKLIKAHPRIKFKNGFYFLRGREELVEQRRMRNSISHDKKKLAKKVINILIRIPTIKSIALSGSVACQNAREDDDIDLFIITSPHTVWSTRLMVYLLLKIMKKLRGSNERTNLFCPNMFVSMQNLEIKDKNVYTASEITHLILIADKENSFGHFLEANTWVKEHFPNVIIGKSSGRNKISPSSSALLKMAENILYTIQYQQMKKKVTNEKISQNRIQFHPHNLSFIILKMWEARRENYYRGVNYNTLPNGESYSKYTDHTPGS